MRADVRSYPINWVSYFNDCFRFDVWCVHECGEDSVLPGTGLVSFSVVFRLRGRCRFRAGTLRCWLGRRMQAAMGVKFVDLPFECVAKEPIGFITRRAARRRERERGQKTQKKPTTPLPSNTPTTPQKKETSKRRGRRCWWWRYGDVAAGDGSESADNEPSPSVKVLSSQSAQTTGRNCLHRGHWLVGCTAAILVSICTSLFFFFFSLFLSFSFFLSFPLFFPRPERAQIGRASTSPTGDEEEEEEEEEEETDKTGSERERERERERKRVSRQWLAANVSNILSSRLS